VEEMRSNLRSMAGADLACAVEAKSEDIETLQCNRQVLAQALQDVMEKLKVIQRVGPMYQNDAAAVAQQLADMQELAVLAGHAVKSPEGVFSFIGGSDSEADEDLEFEGSLASERDLGMDLDSAVEELMKDTSLTIPEWNAQRLGRTGDSSQTLSLTS